MIHAVRSPRPAWSAAFGLQGASTLASRPVAPCSKRRSPSCLLHTPPPALHTCRGARAVDAAAVAAGGRPGALGAGGAGDRWARLQAALSPGNGDKLAALCDELDIGEPITRHGSLLPERPAACLMLGWELLRHYGASEPPALAASSADRASSHAWEADCRRCYRQHKSLELVAVFDRASYSGAVAALLVQLAAPSSRRYKSYLVAGLVAMRHVSEWLEHGGPGGSGAGGCNCGDE